MKTGSEKYQVGYFEGAVGEAFQPLREFDTEEDARYYVQLNYFDDVEVQPQNIAIVKDGRVLFDGRSSILN